MLYETAILSTSYNDAEMQVFSASIEELSDMQSTFVREMFVAPSGPRADDNLFSPFTPYSLYQAAVVQRRLWQRRGSSHHREAFEQARSVLETFNKRWRIADVYLRRLDAAPAEPSSTLCFLWRDRALSARGPTGDPAQPYAA